MSYPKALAISLVSIVIGIILIGLGLADILNAAAIGFNPVIGLIFGVAITVGGILGILLFKDS